MKGGTTRIPDERIFSSFPKNKLIYEKKKETNYSLYQS